MKGCRQEPIVSNDKLLRLKTSLLDVSDITLSSFCSGSMSGNEDASAATGEPVVFNTGANPLAAFRRTRNSTIVALMVELKLKVEGERIISTRDQSRNQYIKTRALHRVASTERS